MSAARERLARAWGAARDLRCDLGLVVARRRRSQSAFPRLATCLDMSAAALVLLRASIALRAAVGTSLGTREALRWVFKIDVWTDDIGGGLALPHPFNIVVGNGVHIGSGCTIMHNTTIQHGAGTTLGDRAVLGVGAVLLAGRTVGAGAFCGANSVVTTDVASGVTVVGVPARPIHRFQAQVTHAA